MHRGAKRIVMAGLSVGLLLAGLRGLTAAYQRGLLPGRPPTPIEKAALQALWDWRSTVWLRYAGSIEEPDTPLSMAVRVYSLILVRPAATPITVVRDGWIETWYALDLVRALSRRPPVGWGTCPSPPRAIPLSEKRLALRMAGGTARVFGIWVTYEWSFQRRIRLTPGLDHLIVGDICDNGVVLISPVIHSVFSIDSSGRLALPTPPRGDRQYDDDLLALGTLERVERYLDTQKGQSQ